MLESITCSNSVFWGYCCPLIALQYKSAGTQGVDRLYQADSGCLECPHDFLSQWVLWPLSTAAPGSRKSQDKVSSSAHLACSGRNRCYFKKGLTHSGRMRKAAHRSRVWRQRLAQEAATHRLEGWAGAEISPLLPGLKPSDCCFWMAETGSWTGALWVCSHMAAHFALIASF